MIYGMIYGMVWYGVYGMDGMVWCGAVRYGNHYSQLIHAKISFG